MADIVLWQYRWTNPGGDSNVPPSMLEWKEVKPWNPHMQTLEQRVEELRSFRCNGKPAYEVRALGVIPAGVKVIGPAPTVERLMALVRTIPPQSEREQRDSFLAEIEAIALTLRDGVKEVPRG